MLDGKKVVCFEKISFTNPHFKYCNQNAHLVCWCQLLRREYDDRYILRGVMEGDLLVEYQQDRDANYMAVFTMEGSNNWDLFSKNWAEILADESIIKQTIIVKQCDR